MIERHTVDSSLDVLKRLLRGESGCGRALAENLEDNPICTVSCDPEVPCLVVQWKGYATTAQTRFVHECVIQLIKKHHVSKILGDDRALVSIATADQHWIVSDWMPRAIAAGLKSAASIKPRGYFGKASVDRILSFVPAGLAIRSFERIEEGKAWLRGALQPGTYRIIYRRFRSGESINAFSFWCQDPSVGYFAQIARVALRGFWRIQDGALEPVISRQPLPELIVIEGENSDEVCCWSLEDEMRELQEADHSASP
jgi:hypothetical protein